MDFFELERRRDNLSKKGDVDAFVGTYSRVALEIRNLNTGKKWDKLNDLKRMSFAVNPMAYERTKYVAGNVGEGKILDIGSGPGNLENLLKGRSNDVIGIDISSKSVARTKKMFPKYKFVVGDFLNMNIKSLGKFDCVTALEVMEHISPSKTFTFLKKVKQVLKPGGIFVVSVPLNEGLEEMIPKGENPNAHVRAYTPSIIRTELKVGGFDVLEERYLYAFSNNYYLKSFIAQLTSFMWHPNNMILVSKNT